MSLPISSSLPSLRASTKPSSPTTYICTQCRHANLLRRPKRPYTFTQLITMTDGSTFQHRTTSPTPVYRATRDTRNAPMWNPSSPKLVNFEVDEAGRLAAFRARFGRSFDAGTAEEEVVEKAEQGEGETEKEKRKQDQQQQLEEEDDNLLDLISSFGQEEAPLPEPKAKGKGRK